MAAGTSRWDDAAFDDANFGWDVDLQVYKAVFKIRRAEQTTMASAQRQEIVRAEQTTMSVAQRIDD